MEDKIFYIGLIISLLLFIFALFYFFIEEGIIDLNNSNNSEEKIQKSFNNKKINKQKNSLIEDSQNSQGIGGGSSSGGSSGEGSAGGGPGDSEGSSESGTSQEESGETGCFLIRPGNIPNIGCSINYIRVSELSLKISNSFGEDLNMIINVDTCSPEIENLVLNNQGKDFVFQCNNNNYFDEEIAVSYVFEEIPVEIGGFITGPVS